MIRITPTFKAPVQQKKKLQNGRNFANYSSDNALISKYEEIKNFNKKNKPIKNGKIF